MWHRNNRRCSIQFNSSRPLKKLSLKLRLLTERNKLNTTKESRTEVAAGESAEAADSKPNEQLEFKSQLKRFRTYYRTRRDPTNHVRSDIEERSGSWKRQ